MGRTYCKIEKDSSTGKYNTKISDTPIDGPSIEANKEVTIDVSTYTVPVEITPTSPNEVMEKSTITLSNIPSGGATAYAWMTDSSDNPYFYFPFTTAPTDKVDYLTKCAISATISVDFGQIKLDHFANENDTYTRTSNTQFSVVHYIDGDSIPINFTRDSTSDITFWQVNE